MRTDLVHDTFGEEIEKHKEAATMGKDGGASYEEVI